METFKEVYARMINSLGKEKFIFNSLNVFTKWGGAQGTARQVGRDDCRA